VRLAERSRIVLLAGKGMTNEEIGDELGITCAATIKMRGARQSR
jgi:DNA-binding NarL/FixJ family response regulator